MDNAEIRTQNSGIAAMTSMGILGGQIKEVGKVEQQCNRVATLLDNLSESIGDLKQKSVSALLPQVPATNAGGAIGSGIAPKENMSELANRIASYGDRIQILIHQVND